MCLVFEVLVLGLSFGLVGLWFGGGPRFEWFLCSFVFAGMLLALGGFVGF